MNLHRRLLLHCFLAASLLSACLASRAESPQAAALRAKVTLAVIKKWSPDMTFHSDEKYFPASAEQLFKGAKVFKVKDHEVRVGEAKPVTGPNDLANLTGEWRIAFDRGNPAFLGGEVEGRGPDRIVTAPMYVSVQIPEDAHYVGIRYEMLFGFNGPQSMRCNSPSSFNYTMTRVAEHEGDWEGFEIRLTPDLSSIIMGRAEAHGNSEWYRGAEFLYTDGTHAQLRLALNSHGVYNARWRQPVDWIVLEDLKVASVVDFITAKGVAWRPWKLPEASRPFRRFGSLEKTEAWSSYRGRMGTYKLNKPDGVHELDGSNLSALKVVAAGAHLALFQAGRTLKFVDQEVFWGMPCGGPGSRNEYNEEAATPLPSLDGLRKVAVYANGPGSLVLSVDRKNPAGDLILADFAAGDPAQRWYRMETGGTSSLINVLTGNKAYLGQAKDSRPCQVPRSITCPRTQAVIQGDPSYQCTIVPEGQGELCLAALGQTSKSGSPVGLFIHHKDWGNQYWRIMEEEPSTPRSIRAFGNSKLALESSGNEVLLRNAAAGNNAQHWLFSLQANGAYTIRNAATGQVLGAENRNIRLVPASTAPGPWNTWIMAGPERTTLRPAGSSSMAVTLHKNQIKAGTPIILWTLDRAEPFKRWTVGNP